ncbi:hypothetical protein BDK51DRAFT_27937 [Blyttiomyces helicus]|uniref:Uncharacterized protein n=1 Tax=Blyttiomyces helicus TaxID=388810 RepID=A0A4V1ISE5_9FUNG|nr:hypothetical protein BDK51DRAFT_27937 [Blyttiomyces helicus]|eukprot:RKO93277.1 hypothetical protein BDK51DRAFT_27937 [Blyttiomyces helicus]
MYPQECCWEAAGADNHDMVQSEIPPAAFQQSLSTKTTTQARRSAEVASIQKSSTSKATHGCRSSGTKLNHFHQYEDPLLGLDPIPSDSCNGSARWCHRACSNGQVYSYLIFYSLQPNTSSQKNRSILAGDTRRLGSPLLSGPYGRIMGEFSGDSQTMRFRLSPGEMAKT